MSSEDNHSENNNNNNNNSNNNESNNLNVNESNKKDDDKHAAVNKNKLEKITETNEAPTDTSRLLNASSDVNSSSDRHNTRRRTLFSKNILTRPASNEPPDLYIELEELYTDNEQTFFNSAGQVSNTQWRISSRWIKYEQTIDPETNIWSKPFVGALVYQNLAFLKTTLQYGTIILDSEKETWENVIEEIIADAIKRNHMSPEYSENLKSILSSQHRNHLTIASAMARKKSKARMADLMSSDGKHSRLFNPHQSTSDFGSHLMNRKNSIFGMNRKNSLFFGKTLGENLNNSEHNLSDKKNAVKFFIPSGLHESVSYADPSHLQVPNQAQNINKSRQSIVVNKTPVGSINNSINLNYHHSKTIKSDLHMMGGAIEAFLIMVGVVDFLDKPTMAFVRLKNDQFIDHLIEYGVKVRFLFVFLGPERPNIDYHEIGRCMGTLMTNKEFHDCAFSAKNRQELLKGITTFTNKNLCLVLPIGEFDDDLLSPALDWIKKMMNRKLAKINKKKNETRFSHAETLTILDKDEKDYDSALKDEKKHGDVEHDAGGGHGGDGGFNPFRKTGHLFGCLFNEVKYRYTKYFTDIKDGLNLHCFIAFVFIFTVCVAPALCFGGILADKTDQSFGVNEMLLATSLNGIVFSLFSGQPLMIFGATGPFLVFEEMLYNFCIKFCIDFLATRVWVGIWVLVFALALLASESVHIIHFVTRFTEEIFAFLIALVFLADAIKKIFYYFAINPIYNIETYCKMKYPNNTLYTPNEDFYSSSNLSNFTSTLSAHLENSTKIKKFHSNGCINKAYYSYKYKKQAEPNIALISVSLLLGTCVLALCLKKLRRSNFFESYIRRTLSDVGILISIVLMVLVDIFIRNKTSVNTQKLDIPDELIPTKPRSWFVSPFGNNYGQNENYTNLMNLSYWVPLAAIFPAFIIFIVLFFEIELTGIILNAKHRKLVKGTGFNLDLLLGAIMMTVNGFFGLPWLCAAPVRTLAHWASLCVYSTSYIPGEKPRLVAVREQRLTNLFVHIGIGLCLKGKFFLRMIPVPVLFGVFLYFGIVSLSGTQLFERIKYLFIPFKYCPNFPYATAIRPSKRNIFTIIQIIAVIVLLAFKSYANISFLFPIVLVLLVPFRKFFLPKIFSHKELDALDDENEAFDDDIVHDFYEITHLPI